MTRGINGQAASKGFVLKLKHVLLNIGVELGQCGSAAPRGSRSCKNLPRTVNRILSVWCSERAHSSADAVFEFGLDSQRCSETGGREQVQSGLKTIDFPIEIPVFVDRKLGKRTQVFPIVDRKDIRFIGVRTSFRAGWRSVPDRQLAQGMRYRMQHLTYQCSSFPLLLRGLPIRYPNGSGNGCNCTQGATPKRGNRFEQLDIDALRDHRKEEQDRDTGARQDQRQSGL